MTRRAPLSPIQSAAYAMGRVLVLFEVWERRAAPALDSERAMLLDFAAQHPRALSGLVPELPRVLRAHRLHEGDLGDLFAGRQFDLLRERFSAVLTDLLARDLLAEVHEAGASGGAQFALTERGRAAAAEFTSALSFAFRAVDEAFCDAWSRKNASDLTAIIRTTLPDHARDIADLNTPLPIWFADEVEQQEVAHRQEPDRG